MIINRSILMNEFFLFFYRIYSWSLFLALMFLFLPFMIIAAFFGIYIGGSIIFFLIKIWAMLWYFFCGLRHENSGLRPDKKDGPFIYVANHDSYLDAPITMLSLHGQFRALGKTEIRRIPFFGWIYRYGVILVDRSDKENRATSVRILKHVLSKKINIIIVPEGGFNYTENHLGKFYDGAFRIAIETQTPIVPMVYLNVKNILPRDSFFKLSPGKTKTIFLEKVPVNGMTMENIRITTKAKACYDYHHDNVQFYADY